MDSNEDFFIGDDGHLWLDSDIRWRGLDRDISRLVRTDTRVHDQLDGNFDSLLRRTFTDWEE